MPLSISRSDLTHTPRVHRMATTPKTPKRVLPSNLGKTSNTASKINTALSQPEAIKILGILTTGEAGTAELARHIKTNDLVIDEVIGWLIKAKLVAKVKAAPKAPASFALTDLGTKAWSAVQSLAC
jgi:hypothetical protein